MQIHLVAVQPKLAMRDFARFETFAERMEALLARAVEGLDRTAPTLVVLPEDLGLYLAFVPYHWRTIESERRLDRAVQKILGGRAPADTARAGVPAVDDAPVALFLEHAVETDAFYEETFGTLARRHGVYLAAGTFNAPLVEQSPHRGGRFVADPTRLYKQSRLFSPRGLSLLRTCKVHLPPGPEAAWLDGASVQQLVPAATGMGRIGTLICFDGFHHGPIEQQDARGAQIIAHLLHFPGPQIRFDGSGKFVPHPEDFVSLIQGRESIQYGVGAFLVGEVFEDMRAEGLSFIARNTGDPEAPWQEAIVARAERPFEEAIVRATVELAESATGGSAAY